MFSTASDILQAQCCSVNCSYFTPASLPAFWFVSGHRDTQASQCPVLTASWLQIPAVHDFGLFMSLIVTCCWLAVLFTMPAALGLWSLYMAPLESSCQSRWAAFTLHILSSHNTQPSLSKPSRALVCLVLG